MCVPSYNIMWHVGIGMSLSNTTSAYRLAAFASVEGLASEDRAAMSAMLTPHLAALELAKGMCDAWLR